MNPLHGSVPSRALLLGALLSCACTSAAAPPMDSSVSSDLGIASTQDVFDGGTNAGDAASGVTCNGIPLEPLPASHLTWDDRTTGPRAGGGLQPPTRCGFAMARQRIFSYRTASDAVLRITTSNPGTSPSLDTVVLLTEGSCDPAASAFLGCNDDEALRGDGYRATSTAVAERTIRAGTNVQIAVGIFSDPRTGARSSPDSELGTIELRVDELAPAGVGGSCDVARRSVPCADGLACAQGVAGPTGTCRAVGTFPGSTCRPDGTCAAGLECSTDRLCVESGVAPGDKCDQIHLCAPPGQCVADAPGAPSGTCRPEGASGAPCRLYASCDAGLACRWGTCLPSSARGGPCNEAQSVCPAPQSCITPGDGSHAGTCADPASRPGAACLPADGSQGPVCGTAGLVCTHGSCGTEVAVGAACGPFAGCARGATCIADGASRTGRCLADGSQGAACGAAGSGMLCDAGLACASTADDPVGHCVRTLSEGSSCSAAGTVCAPGSDCGVDGAGSVVCIRTGRSGGRCRVDGDPCEADSLCSASLPQSGACQRVTTGAACDAASSSDRCSDGRVCRATSATDGQCVAPTQEAEPNDAPNGGLLPTTTPAAILGSLGPADLDCWVVDVPANGHVFARLTTRSGQCVIDLDRSSMELDLYRLAATGPQLLGSDVQSFVPTRFLPGACPRIDGNDPAAAPWARGLSAGRYAVCARGAVPVSDYVLSLDVGAP